MIFKKCAAKVKWSSALFLVFLMFTASSVAQAQTKKRGKVTTRYANGNKESSGKVKNYKKQGTWKYWDENGKPEKTITYKDDRKNGLCTSYYNDGNKSAEGNYVDDLKDGEWKGWYSGNVNSFLTHYANGKKDGVQEFWYPNGQLQTAQKYDSDVLVYEWKWFDNGHPQSISYYKNGLPDGTWRTYADPATTSDTLPISIDNYSDGKKNGLHSGYSHGKLSEEIFYKDDKLDGTYKKWDTNGMLGISENYVNGNREGLCKYFNHGKCIREAAYSKGKLDGSEKEYDEEGKLFRMSWYNQGRVDSTSNYFGNGQKSISRIYKYYPGFVKTEEFSDYSEWDPQGHLLLKGTYHFEEREKSWTTYYPDGKIKSITPYSSGKISGVYKKWYANGKELIEMECEGNEVTTAPKVWDEKGNPIKAGTKKYQEIVDSSKPGEIYNDPKKYKENRTKIPTDEIMETQEVANPDSENNNQAVFAYAEQMPEFPGGSDAMMSYLQKNIMYPEIDREAGKQGTVYIKFVVETDGTVTNVEPVKEVAGAPELTREAMRVVRSMPNWIPAKQNGKSVRIYYTLPIRFQLK